MKRKVFYLSQFLLVITLITAFMLVAGCSSSSTPTPTPTQTLSPTPTATLTPSSPAVSPSASPTPSQSASPSTAAFAVNISTKAAIGNYLVDSKGMTLYFTTRDSVGKSNITGATLANWPVFYSPTVTVPTTLKASDFGVITRDDGTPQTTYKGWPLYYFINDKAAGDTNGNGVAGVWFVINPANFPPTPSATPSATASPATSPSATSTPSPSTTVSTSPAAGGSITINLTAQSIAFNMSTITVPAGAKVTVNFNNKDSGIPHNFSVYTNSAATTAIFTGQTVTGPATMTYTFTAPTTAGTYFFRCDIHPTIMTGSFVVTAASSTPASGVSGY